MMTPLMVWLALLGPAQQGNDDITYMNQPELQIPILQSDPQLRSQIERIVLYISNDQGRTWQETARATSQDVFYPFNAPRDGAYWFALSTHYKDGRIEPRDIRSEPPALKLVIDTTRPAIKLSQMARENDIVHVGWQIVEPNLDSATLQLEYQVVGQEGWNAVAINQLASSSKRFSVLADRAVRVRMQAADLAKNVAQAVLEIPPSAPSDRIVRVSGREGEGSVTPTPAAPPAPPAPLFANPGATNSPWPPVGSGRPNVNNDYIKPTPAPPVVVPPVPQVSNPPRTTGSEGMPSWAKMALPVDPTPALAPASTQLPPTNITLPPSQETPGRTVIARSRTPSGLPMPEARPWAGAPPATSSGTHTPGAAMTPLATGVLPPIRYINQQRVALKYEISKVGPSGVGSVELYITQDDGRNWRLHATDEDLAPPLEIDFPGEGLYGLMLVVRSRAGLGRSAPRPGEAPEIRVEVDLSAPMAELENPEADPRRRDTLILLWNAQDKNLATGPVTLQWSEREAGPWTTIASNLPNTGRHTWQMPQNLPYMVYLRLEVRDLAGNVSEAITNKPVLVDLQEPEGKLTEILVAPRK